MSDKLPQGNFGAGYPYGGPGSNAPLTPTHGGSTYNMNLAGSAAPPSETPRDYPDDPPTAQAPFSGYGPAAPFGSSPAGAAVPAYGLAPYLTAAAPVSGAAAIIAGVLAVLIGIYRGFTTYGYFTAAKVLASLPSYAGHNGGAQAFVVVVTIASAIGTVALFVGALLLLSRNKAGRRWITLGCLIAIADVIVSWLWVYVFLNGFANWFSSALGPSSGLSGDNLVSGVLRHEAPVIILNIAISAGIPLLTMLLALSASARRWCESRPGGYISAAGPAWSQPTVNPAHSFATHPDRGNAAWNRSAPISFQQAHADYYRQATEHFGAELRPPTASPGPPLYPAAQPSVAASAFAHYSYPNAGQQDSFVIRLMERGVRGELLCQPWFHDVRGRFSEPLLIATYAAGVVISTLLAQIPSMLVATILNDALWVGIGYLYLAVGTKLAHQFLQYGICLVGTLVMLWSTLSALTVIGRIARLYRASDPTAVLLFDAMLNLAGGALLVYIGLQVHRGIQRLSA